MECKRFGVTVEMSLSTSDASMCVVGIIKLGSEISVTTPLACRVRQH